jgi:hypothetical protein
MSPKRANAYDALFADRKPSHTSEIDVISSAWDAKLEKC